jgi:hypothetical protein
MENAPIKLTPAENRLRIAGWSRGRWTAFLLACTEDEIIAIANAETGEDLRQVLNEIEDRKNAPPEETEEPEPE